MNTVRVGGKLVRIASSQAVGKGGEADIFNLGNGQVLKLYKRPDDADYIGNQTAQHGAWQRIEEQQRKLPAFPRGLPPEVVAPTEVVFDQRGSRIVGYTMPFISGAEVLLRLGDRQYREQGGVDGNQVVATFRKLHEAVSKVHQARVVIGDFNDLNVLVGADQRIFLVDADSMQFGRFFCRTFTARFVDPLLCEPDQLALARPHNERSDWYAFAVMLMQSLLYVGPYGGVHRPKAGRRLQHDARALQRLTVFDSDVVYPRPALPLGVLSDDLLGHFEQVFAHDLRGQFPGRLLELLRWTTCAKCGAVHARAVCPECAAPGVVKESVTIRGTVKATRVFRTKGHILHAVVQRGNLHYLYHEDGAFRREGDRIVVNGTLDPELRFRISRGTSLLGRRNRLLAFEPSGERDLHQTDTAGHLSIFDANEQGYYWISGGQLVRSGTIGPEYIGDVLSGRTLFWTGNRFGFGFYQAGQLSRSFVFNTEGRGINDRVAIPALPGQLIDATCVFSDKLAWFMVSVQDGGRIVNRCFVVSSKGEVLAETEASEDDDSWLAAGIRGHFAGGDSLFAATDDGIVRVQLDGSLMRAAQTFPDTKPFVSSYHQLLPGPGGIYAVRPQDITLLTIGNK